MCIQKQYPSSSQNRNKLQRYQHLTAYAKAANEPGFCFSNQTPAGQEIMRLGYKHKSVFFRKLSSILKLQG